MPAAAPSTDASVSISSADWKWVENLIRDVEEHEKLESFLAVFLQWHLAIPQFRRLECDTLGEEERPREADVQRHAACMRTLMSIGEFLKVAAKHHPDEDFKPHGFSRGSIGAMCAELQYSWEDWHTEVDAGRVAALKEKIFNGPS